MAEQPALVFQGSPGNAPQTYQLPPGFSMDLTSVSATFDGAAASAAFLPCLSIYSQDDKLIGRFFPPGGMRAGDSGEVTFATFLVGQQATNVGAWALYTGTVDIPNAATAQTDITYTSVVTSDDGLFTIGGGAGIDIVIRDGGAYTFQSKIIKASANLSFVDMLIAGSTTGWDYIEGQRTLQGASAWSYIRTEVDHSGLIVRKSGINPLTIRMNTYSTATALVAGVVVRTLIVCVGDDAPQL
jgi:hypothetical protein